MKYNDGCQMNRCNTKILLLALVVIATLFNAGGEHASGSTIWLQDETLEEAKQVALEEAKENFDDVGGCDALGVVYNVTKVKVPQIPSVTIVSEDTIEPVKIETL